LLREKADKAEDFILISVGPRLGLDHNKVESLGRRFRGTWRDYLTLIVIRAIPFFPTFVVSAACGVIKLNLRLYITGSLVGNYCRSIFFMLLGYAGFSASSQLLTELNSLQTWFEILFVLLAIAGLGWIYWKRRKRNL